MGWCWLCEQDGAPEKFSAFKARIYRHAAGDVYTNYHNWSCNPTQKAHHQAEGKGGGEGAGGEVESISFPIPSIPPALLPLSSTSAPWIHSGSSAGQGDAAVPVADVHLEAPELRVSGEHRAHCSGRRRPHDLCPPVLRDRRVVYDALLRVVAPVHTRIRHAPSFPSNPPSSSQAQAKPGSKRTNF